MEAGRKSISTKKDWNTPIKYVNAIVSFFKEIGYEIELDPATNHNSLIPAKTKYILPVDGLNESWDFKSIYINSPFGSDKERKTNLKSWIKKAYDTNKNFGSEILILLPCSLNTKHFQEIIFTIKNGGVCFLKDSRLRFLDSSNNNNEDKKGAPIGMCMVYMGLHYAVFEKIFKEFGKCFEIIN